jgi:hypothetical protein
MVPNQIQTARSEGPISGDTRPAKPLSGINVRTAVVRPIPRTSRPFSAAMHCRVASIAQCNQVLFRIVARVAAKIFMVHIKVGHRTANLASPTIAAEDLVAETIVLAGIEPQGARFGRT